MPDEKKTATAPAASPASSAVGKPRAPLPVVSEPGSPGSKPEVDPFFHGFKAGKNVVENRSNQVLGFYFNPEKPGDVADRLVLGPSDDRDDPTANPPTERSIDAAGLRLLRLHPVFRTCESNGTIKVREG